MRQQRNIFLKAHSSAFEPKLWFRCLFRTETWGIRQHDTGPSVRALWIAGAGQPARRNNSNVSGTRGIGIL